MAALWTTGCLSIWLATACADQEARPTSASPGNKAAPSGAGAPGAGGAKAGVGKAAPPVIAVPQDGALTNRAPQEGPSRDSPRDGPRDGARQDNPPQDSDPVDSPSRTQPERGEFGFAPITITVEDAQASYDAWKEVHLEDCENGVYRVRWENERLNATVSEGIGYGMLLTVMWDDQAAFDGLYEYYQLGQNTDTGLMHWLRYDCDAHYEDTYNPFPNGAAADADLDVAMGLIMADCRWGGGNYAAEASKVIRAIARHMFVEDDGRHLLLPGDSGWFHQMRGGCVNYSYFAPAYYREFASYDAERSDFWHQAAEDSYLLLNAASHEATGLVRNWGSARGQDATEACHNAYNRSASYGDDAARTPWRVVTDYLWNGTPAAKEWTDKVTRWVAGEGIQDTVQWYNLDGTPDTGAGTWDDHTAINVGPWATGAMSYDQPTVDAFAKELVAIPAGPRDHDGEYFPRMLKALSLSTLVGKFTTCGGVPSSP